MKKTKTKLQLKANTVRLLQVSELDQVNGGHGERRSTFTGCNTQQQQGCGSHPPDHPPTSGHH
jgi:hypothetical protein